jgi:hypothetical protein
MAQTSSRPPSLLSLQNQNIFLNEMEKEGKERKKESERNEGKYNKIIHNLYEKLYGQKKKIERETGGGWRSN